MRPRARSGIWELFVPGQGEGTLYKYEVRTKTARSRKTDPAGLLRGEAAQIRRSSGISPSVAGARGAMRSGWRSAPATSALRSPMAIYEVHSAVGTHTRRQRLPDLSRSGRDDRRVCRQEGYTHVQPLPVTDTSRSIRRGATRSRAISATSRFGSPDDFQYFVDHLHGVASA